MKQEKTHRHREQACGFRGGGKDGLKACCQQMQSGIYRMDKQQGPAVYHRKLYSISCDES